MRIPLVLACLAACSEPPPPAPVHATEPPPPTPMTPTTPPIAAPPPTAAATPGRHVTPRSKLEVPAADLPRHGLYAVGGGFMSSPWRVIVDRDAKTIRAGKTPNKPGSSASTPAQESTRPLTDAELAQLTDLGEAAWRETRLPPASPIADYDEVLVVVDGDDGYRIEGYGPIRDPASAAAIKALLAASKLF